jgi:gamma-glutamyl hydrolase
MLNRAIKANDEGDYFPIMAVCLGHEAIHYILSDYDSV